MRNLLASLTVLSLLGACDDGSGPGNPDAAAVTPDSAVAADAPATDGPAPVVDADVADALVPMSDAAPLGGTSAASLQIQAVIQAPAGTVDLMVNDVLVTYVKPDGTGDVAGFFVQAEQIGPAVFVGAASSTPALAPAVGDRVSFHVTGTVLAIGATRVTAVDGFTVSDSGIDVEPLRQNLSGATDLATNVGLYASELIHLDGTIVGPFEAAATGHMRAPVTTQGVPDPQPVGGGGLWLRLPVPPFDVSGVTNTCVFSLDGVVWRFNADVQPSSYVPAELSFCL